MIECFGRLDDFAIGHEHCRVGEPALHELQGAEAVVEEAVSMAAEFQKIDLYPAGVEVVGERLRKLTEVVVVAVGGINQVEADDAESLHLIDRALVEQSDVDDDVRWRIAGLDLETDAEPAMVFAGVAITSCAHGVTEREEGRVGAAFWREAIEQYAVLVF